MNSLAYAKKLKPEAHCIFKILSNARGDQIQDAEFLYVNSAFCIYSKRTEEELLGSTFLEVFPYGNNKWFYNCLRAVKYGECAEGLMFYSATTGHWINASIYPSHKIGCAVVVFTLANQENLKEVYASWMNKLKLTGSS